MTEVKDMYRYILLRVFIVFNKQILIAGILFQHTPVSPPLLNEGNSQ